MPERLHEHAPFWREKIRLLGFMTLHDSDKIRLLGFTTLYLISTRLTTLPNSIRWMFPSINLHDGDEGAKPRASERADAVAATAHPRSRHGCSHARSCWHVLSLP